MKAIILLSGGIDSTVLLAMAHKQGYNCLAISFNYGQRNHVELDSARAVAAYYNAPQHVITIYNAAFAGSSLVNENYEVPTNRTPKEISEKRIPSTYVPARNTLFLSYALSFAEITQAQEIYFGANALDAEPYPDCRPAYLKAFQSLINLATRQSVEEKAPRLITPLIEWDKAKIITEGLRLGAPLDLTFSCYSPTPAKQACEHCDACALRREGFKNAGYEV